MLISLMDGSLVWANQHHQSGTMMPSGAVHTIFASQRAAGLRECAPDDRLREAIHGAR